jgi:hypothetical protein
MWRVIQTASMLVMNVTKAISTTMPITAPEKATSRDWVLRTIPVQSPTIGPTSSPMPSGIGAKTPKVIAAARASCLVCFARSFRKTQKPTRQMGARTVTLTPMRCTMRGTLGLWRRAANARAEPKYRTVAISDPVAMTQNIRDVLRIFPLPTGPGSLRSPSDGPRTGISTGLADCHCAHTGSKAWAGGRPLDVSNISRAA